MKSKSKSKSSKTAKVTQSWRDKLAELDINNIYSGRTCEVILMAELSVHFAETRMLFEAGAKANPTNVVKCINLETLVLEFKNNKQSTIDPLKSNTKISAKKTKGDPNTALLQSAAAEVKDLFNKGLPISLELIAQLLKLKIITMINEDVALRDEERRQEVEILNPGDVKVVFPVKVKKTAKTLKEKSKSAIVNLPVEERLLFFILLGFYEPDIVKELWSIKIPLSAIIELGSLDAAFAEKRKNESSRNLNSVVSETLDGSVNEIGEEDEEIVLFVNKYFPEPKDSVCYSSFNILHKSSPSVSLINVLLNFWSTIYIQLEGESQSEIFEDTVHMRLTPWLPTNSNITSQKVFAEICKDILKIPAFKRQHKNYLNHLKIIEIEECLDIDREEYDSHLSEFELLQNVPPDCFTNELLLHCLVEEVSNRVPNTKNSITSLKNTDQCSKSSIDPIDQAEIERVPVGDNIKPLQNLAEYLLQFRKNRSPFCRTGITYHHSIKPKPKIKIKPSKEPYAIYESNNLEFKLNSYQQLSSLVLKTNLNVLEMSPTVFLWKLYPHLDTIEVIYKNHQLQTWSRILQLPLEDIEQAITAIEFEILPCSSSSFDKKFEDKNAFHDFFPTQHQSEILKNALPKVRYIQTPEISYTTIAVRKNLVKIPDLTYLDIPNIYDAKNISTYLWYEKLTPSIMLQELKRANSDFVCIEHKYCPFIDAIILRYHNKVDKFGINTTTWNSSLRTPICFRDFCKYIVHEESSWLEKEEDYYQDILKEKDRQIKENLASTENLSESAGNNFSFFAYDLGRTRIQLKGATTVFHSLDGYKIIVDRTHFLGQPSTLSLNVTLMEHSFFLHYCNTKRNDPLLFHFCLADGTLIVFSKPPKVPKPEVTIVEKVLPCSKSGDKLNKRTAYQPREQNFYYVTDRKQYYLKSIKVSSVIRNSVILPEGRAFSYLDQTRKINSSANGRRMEQKNNTESSGLIYNIAPNKCLDPKEVIALYVAPGFQKNDLQENGKMDISTSESAGFQIEREDLLRKIKKAKKLQIPMFKICSSKLHKFEYTKPIKSLIHIKIGRHAISLLCKHPFYKISRNIEAIKVFPLKLNDSKFPNNNSYDVKLTLPSGLLIYTLPGTDNTAFNIKQRYLDKGPQCINIKNEFSRTFTRDGHLIIKKVDGTLEILSVNGQIIQTEIPYANTKRKTRYDTRRRTSIKQKFLRVINRRHEHIIGGFRYRKFALRTTNKLHAKNQIYVKQNGLFQFTLITHNGKHLKVTETNIKKKNEIFQTTIEDDYQSEFMYVRDDGTKSVLYSGGLLTTQFPDETRMSSWFTETCVAVFDEVSDMNTDSLESFAFDDYEGWILIQMFYKFEHPNYAAVLISSDNYETEINLPNSVLLNVAENGHYFLDVDDMVSAVVNEDLVYLESKACTTCMHRSITVLNVKPLYNEENPIADDTELLKTCDSYEKVFVVNYDGTCFRNSNYITHRRNRAQCDEHEREAYQQLFTLNRDLSGKKYWDVKAYERRIKDVTDSNNSVIQYYGKNANDEDFVCQEIRTHEFKHFNMFFLKPTMDEVNFNFYNTKPSSSRPAYTSILQLYAMPKQCMIELFKTSTARSDKTEMEFPNSDKPNTPCKCTSQIKRENSKLNKTETIDDLSQLSALSLCTRWYTWHELNSQYIPLSVDKICKCKSEPKKPKLKKISKNHVVRKQSIDQTSSLEIVPDRLESSSSISTYQQPHRTACECNIPAHFLCDCKSATLNRTEYSEEEYVAQSETPYIVEAKDRNSATMNSSYNIDFHDDVCISGEESDILQKSISETAKKSTEVKPTCHCNPGTNIKTVHDNAMPRKTCTKKYHSLSNASNAKETKKSEAKLSSSTNSKQDLPCQVRQAGGEDTESFFNHKNSEASAEVHRRYLLKELHKKIKSLVINSTTSKTISIINVFQSKLLRFNAVELLKLLERIHAIKKNNKMLLAEDLFNLLLKVDGNTIREEQISKFYSKLINPINPSRNSIFRSTEHKEEEKQTSGNKTKTFENSTKTMNTKKKVIKYFNEIPCRYK